jgi:hypothetical protein
MKRLLCAGAMAVFVVPALADVGISVSVGQPGFYGQINSAASQRRSSSIRSRSSCSRHLWASSRPPPRAAGSREALAQALSRVSRLWAAGLFRARRVVQQGLRAALPGALSRLRGFARRLAR